MAAVMEEKSALGLREVVLIVFSASALFLFISLISFNIEDAGFTHSGSLGSIHNACGVVGAWLSDFTLSLFGLMAYALPFMLGWVGYLVFRDQLHTESSAVILMRYLGFVLTLAFGSAFIYLHFLRSELALPGGTGGILGQELGDLMFRLLDNSGATLVLLVGFLIGVTLFTDLSWFKVMDWIGKSTLKAIYWVVGTLGSLFVANPAKVKDREVEVEPVAVEQNSQPKPAAVKSREKVKIAPMLDPLLDPIDSEEPLLNEPLRGELRASLLKSSENKVSRQEPQFDTSQRQAPTFAAEPRDAAQARLAANTNRTVNARSTGAKLDRQEPQFRTSAAAAKPQIKATDVDLRVTNYPPIIDSLKPELVDQQLTAKVMGFETETKQNQTAAGLRNFPPQLDVSDEARLDAGKAAYAFNDTQAEDDDSIDFSDDAAATTLQTGSAAPMKSFRQTGEVLPSLALLDERDTRVSGYTAKDLEEMSRLVEVVLLDFNVLVEVVAVNPGPVITRFELQPAAGVKVSRISGLSKDVARALSVTSVRIVENIPGKSVIGLEIPNQEREMVTLRELLISPVFKEAKSVLTLAMGKDIAGIPVVADLGKMPHALVAGTTGSGKSVAINTMILSLLYKATPEQVRMIMIDPKMLELSVYEGIPHLLTPVVTDMKEASNALRWAVAEMERRYKLMSKMGVRNIAGFNQLINEATAKGKTVRDPLFAYDKPLGEFEEFPVLSTLPSIVIVIDELADMMMIVGKKVEELIARLAQKARAAGIHLILATQRPSVDVLTGLIKANVPTRISFQVSSRIDSRTILDQGGAETLLGNGDMLFLPAGTAIPIRAHGAFVDDHEVHRVVEFLKQTAPPNYLEEITREVHEAGDSHSAYGGGDEAESDALYDQAVAFVVETRKASISSVQRRFKVGYNRAARMIEDMEAAGVVSAAESNGYREVLAPALARMDD